MALSDTEIRREPASGTAERRRQPEMPAAAEHSRRTAPSRAAFWLVAAVLCLLFFGAAAPTPLYGIYRAQLGFSAITLTAVFAIYALVLLLTLLVFGSVSDYLGRRPVVLTALVVTAGAYAVFLTANSIGLLFAARALQGVGVGVATGALGAALIDLRPGGRGLAPLITAAALAGRVPDLLLAVELELGDRHPFEVAEEAAVVDLASGGRLLLVVRPAAACGRWARDTFERIFVDGTLIGGSTGIVRAGSAAVRAVQSGFLRYYAALLVLGVGALGLYFLLQS